MKSEFNHPLLNQLNYIYLKYHFTAQILYLYDLTLNFETGFQLPELIAHSEESLSRQKFFHLIIAPRMTRVNVWNFWILERDRYYSQLNILNQRIITLIVIEKNQSSMVSSNRDFNVTRDFPLHNIFARQIRKMFTLIWSIALNFFLSISGPRKWIAKKSTG